MISEEVQRKNFVFALRSFASEFGMKPKDWQFRIVNHQERKLMEKEYYPTLWVLPERGTLLSFYINIKNDLTNPLTAKEIEDAKKIAVASGSTYFIAFNENKKR